MVADYDFKSDADITVLFRTDTEIAPVRFNTVCAFEDPEPAAVDCLVCDVNLLLTDGESVSPFVVAPTVGVVAVLTDGAQATTALEAGADEVCLATSAETPSLLEHRIQCACEAARSDGSLLQSVIAGAAGADSFALALKTTIERCCRATQFGYGEAWLPEQGGVSVFTSWGDPGVGTQRQPETDRIEQRYIKTVRAGRALSPKGDSTSEITVPLTANGRAVSVIFLAGGFHAGRQETVLEQLTTVGRRLGSVLVRRRVEDHLKRERKLTKRVFEASPVGVVVFGTDDLVLRSNDRAKKILGDSPAQRVADWTVTDAQGEPKPAALGPLERVRAGERAVFGETVVSEIDGDRRWLSANAVPLEVPDHQWIVLSITDVTDQKRHARDLDRQRQRLEVLHRVLRHDIRTSSNLLLGYADRLDRLESTDIGTDIAAIADRMDRLSNNVGQLAATISTASDQAGNSFQLDLSTSLAKRVLAVKKRYPNASVSHRIEPDVSIETTVTLEAAFDHLLENAVVHADATPVVDVELTTDDTDAIVTIADNGPGIPQAELDVITCRTETPLEHSSGLGLWVVCWSIDAAGGSLSFDASHGTTATIRIPMAASDQPPKATAEERAETDS